MARSPLPLNRPAAAEYFVHDPSVTQQLANVPIVERDGKRVVVLTAAAARYWLDQGIISTEPLEKREGSARELMSQFTRGRIATDDQAKAQKEAAEAGQPAPAEPEQGPLPPHARPSKTPRFSSGTDVNA